MSRSDRRPRQPRKRTAETVVRTHLAIITGIASEGRTISVHHENELVKASLLYADTVEVLSLGNQMVRELSSFAAGDPENLWTLLASLDNDTLRHINPDLDPDQLRQAVSILTTMPPDAMRALAEADPAMDVLNEFAEVLDQTHQQAESSMDELRGVTQQMRTDSGVAELEKALNQKLVRFNENVAMGGDTDAVIQGFLAEIKRYVQDPTKFVLLDATIASLVRSMIAEGLIRPPDRAVSNAGEAVLGTGFLARLPAFTTAPMNEVLDLRRDLDEPLGRYRRKVSHLRGELQTGPFDEHVEAEVDAVWRSEIDPAITEVRMAMADHGLVREILRDLGINLPYFAKGGWLPAGLMLFSANMLDFSTALTTGLTGAAAAAPTVTKAVVNRQKGRAEARTHDLYYLYEVNRRLGS